MTKEVIAAIRGLQFANEEDGDKIEVITPAEYYLRNGSHYLLYTETDEDTGGVTKNIVKFRDHSMELTKKGYVNVHMVFEEQKKNMTSYATPFGNIMVGIDTEKIMIEEDEKKIHVKVDYSLDVNYEQLAACRIAIEICPKEAGRSLM